MMVSWWCFQHKVRARSPDAREAAAIEIQRAWRGYQVRAQIHRLIKALRDDFFPGTKSTECHQFTAEYKRRLKHTSLLQSEVHFEHPAVRRQSTRLPSRDHQGVSSRGPLSHLQHEAVTDITSQLGKHSSVVSRDHKDSGQYTGAGVTRSTSRHGSSVSQGQWDPEQDTGTGTTEQFTAAGGVESAGHHTPTSGQSHSPPSSGTGSSPPASRPTSGSRGVPGRQYSLSLSRSGSLIDKIVEDQLKSGTEAAPGGQAIESREPSDHWQEEALPSDDLHPSKRLKMTKKTAARLVLEASFDRYVQEALGQSKTSAEMMQFVDYCAHRIQTWWLLRHFRFLKQRFIQRLGQLSKKSSLKKAAALEERIEGRSRTPSAGRQTKKRKPGVPPTEREAAVAIQRAWRRHIDIQVYRYYRDLINFKTRGDPAVMLRCINPNEAKLLEPASGTSVRFRLAGDRFPPNIYYKIFTHRPIQDLCANSPKDYTRPEAKQLTVRHKHNKIATLPPQDDPAKEHWYKRFENNGWRLVSDRLIHHIMNDPITWESSQKKYNFDHSKLKRKQDVEKQKKSRKIEWMKKMYKDGMLHARSDDRETVQLIEGAAAGMIATVENQGPEALEDWEVDELLDWTTSLNFEEYFSTWKNMATSAPADRIAEKTMSIGTSHTDPYELTVSTAPSRFPSTGQSRHTPATLSGSVHIKT